MKAEDIDNMQAGREMDALIHELVMGQCAHVLAETERRTERRRVYKCNKCNADSFHFITDYAGRVVGVLDYTTDIKAAWQVVEHFKGYGAGVQIRIVNRFAEAIIADKQARADTAPLAICRAALKAIQKHEGAGK